MSRKKACKKIAFFVCVWGGNILFVTCLSLEAYICERAYLCERKKQRGKIRMILKCLNLPGFFCFKKERKQIKKGKLLRKTMIFSKK